MVGIAVPNGESGLPNGQPRYLARVSDPLTGEFWPPSPDCRGPLFGSQLHGTASPGLCAHP